MPLLALWDLKRPNPRDAVQAEAAGRREVTHRTQDWSGKCARSVAHHYGWAYSGEYSARTLRSKQGPLNTGRNAPKGALKHYAVGNFDHVTLSLGGGLELSNDIFRYGYINIVYGTQIEAGWGARYLGWSLPYFPLAGGPVSTPKPVKKPAVVPELTGTVSLKRVKAAIRDKKKKCADVKLIARQLHRLGYEGFFITETWGTGKAKAFQRFKDKHHISGTGPGMHSLEVLFHGTQVKVVA